MNMESQAPLKVVPSNHPALTLQRSDIEAMAKRVSNWGRWGPDDELGTLNFIGPDELKAAAALVRKGKSISIPCSRPGPTPWPGTRTPAGSATPTTW